MTYSHLPQIHYTPQKGAGIAAYDPSIAGGANVDPNVAQFLSNFFDKQNLVRLQSANTSGPGPTPLDLFLQANAGYPGYYDPQRQIVVSGSGQAFNPQTNQRVEYNPVSAPSSSPSSTSNTQANASAPITAQPVNQNDAAILNTILPSGITVEKNREIARALGYGGEFGNGGHGAYLAQDPQRLLEFEKAVFNASPTGARFQQQAANTKDSIASTLSNRGVNDASLLGEIENELNKIIGQAGYSTSANPSSYFSPNTENDILNKVQSNKRDSYTSQVNQFAAPGFSSSMVQQDADDEIISRILTEENARATERLGAMRSRGILDDQGYNVALSTLGDQFKANQAQLQQVGGQVLNDFRGKLEGLGSEARNYASNYTFGSSFDPSSYKGRIDNDVNNFFSNLEGQLLGQIDRNSLFNLGAVAQTGAASQGPVNGSALFASLNKDKQQNVRGGQNNRGLGTTGAF